MAKGKFAATFKPGFFPSNVRAIWQGNMLYESAVATASVITRTSTATALVSSSNPSNFDSPVTFTATVSAIGTSVRTPTGTIAFIDGTTVLSTVTLNGGSAAFTTSALAVGSHSITAVYSGDFNYLASTSAVLVQKVDGT